MIIKKLRNTIKCLLTKKENKTFKNMDSWVTIGFAKNSEIKAYMKKKQHFVLESCTAAAVLQFDICESIPSLDFLEHCFAKQVSSSRSLEP